MVSMTLTFSQASEVRYFMDSVQTSYSWLRMSLGSSVGALCSATLWVALGAVPVWASVSSQSRMMISPQCPAGEAVWCACTADQRAEAGMCWADALRVRWSTCAWLSVRAERRYWASALVSMVPVLSVCAAGLTIVMVAGCCQDLG